MAGQIARALVQPAALPIGHQLVFSGLLHTCNCTCVRAGTSDKVVFAFAYLVKLLYVLQCLALEQDSRHSSLNVGYPFRHYS